MVLILVLVSPRLSLTVAAALRLIINASWIQEMATVTRATDCATRLLAPVVLRLATAETISPIKNRQTLRK